MPYSSPPNQVFFSFFFSPGSNDSPFSFLFVNCRSQLKIVIDFTATWCVPCRFMEPVINEFAANYTDVEFMKIDVDELMVLLASSGETNCPFMMISIYSLLLILELNNANMHAWIIVITGCGSGIRSASNANICTDKERESP